MFHNKLHAPIHRFRCLLLAFLWCLFALPTPAAQAQPRPGTLRFVVRDATDLAVPGATVTITASLSGVTRTIQANEQGEATFDNLTPGEYVGRVESPGFTPVDVANLRVRIAAQTIRIVSLAIASLTEQIDVSPPDEDTQLLGAFTEQLTAEQIAALPDDPDELAQVLQTLIGDDANILVNGFAGGRLPQGTQIQDIRVRYETASGSGNGGPRVEIRTRPGRGGWRNTVNMNMRDDSLNARNAFSGERPSGRTRQYAYTVSGPLVKNRTGISFSIDRAGTEEQQAIRAARPDGIFSALIAQPSTRTGVNMELEHALTNTQELRMDINVHGSNSLNQGVSEFDLPERAFSRKQSDGEIRIGHRATFRKQWVNNLRFQDRVAEVRSGVDKRCIDRTGARRVYHRWSADPWRPPNAGPRHRERARVYRQEGASDDLRCQGHWQQLHG